MPEISFEFRPATPAETEYTARLLLEHTRNALGASVEHKPFGLLAYEGDRMAGSLIGKIFSNWLHVDLIWVDEAYRRKGIGSSLMKQAAQKALEMGIDGIEVWTQNWQAPDFYRKLGYEEFATLDDFGPGRKRHAFRYYIKKYERTKNATPLAEVIREHIKNYFAHHGDTLPPPGIHDRLLPLFEKPLIEVTLQATGGNQLKAAALLGINRNTLHKRIVDLGIHLQGGKP